MMTVLSWQSSFQNNICSFKIATILMLPDIKFWQFIRAQLSQNMPVILLCVGDSDGSSPGRQGFCMAVSANNLLYGTIGGGIMEHKLVEVAKTMLRHADYQQKVMYQYHDKTHSAGQSGMICSGWQTVIFMPMLPIHNTQISIIIESIIEQKNSSIKLSSSVQITLQEQQVSEIKFNYENENNWSFEMPVQQQKTIHIIGAGHSGLALSEIMKFLGFYVKIYDDRAELNTLCNNQFADEKRVVSYENIGNEITINKQDFVVIMTIGYRYDKIVLKQLLGKNYFYIGMLGSQNKIKTLFAELEKEGVNPEKWKHVFTPIGLNIASKTTQEIAVSIAAEIIKEKNKNQPSQRKIEHF